MQQSRLPEVRNRTVPAPSGESPLSAGRGRILALALGALGVVYGDIGTSPLYAIKECFHGIHAIEVNQDNIFGVISLVFWSLTMVVSVKYVGFIMRADNRNEGGIFALLALIPSDRKRVAPRLYSLVILIAILGAALLYGDGIITPSITVLSAVEGLEVATHALAPVVVPITCAILFVLFLVQHRGTMEIGRVFGPVMMLWFVVISGLGLKEVLVNPHILSAVNPKHAYDFFAANRLHGMVVLGSVVLCITGGEALYADMGHFGRTAIKLSWLTVAYPALLLNYFGQGALLLDHPELAFNPFYGVVPPFLLYPLVILSTIASVIASQSMISGVFSLTQQAVQLGFCPRLRIIHTSRETQGQIYIPAVNYAMMLACIGLVLAFKGSSGLAGAYGIAVTATMTLTSFLYFFVLTKTWNRPLWQALPVVLLFLVFDVSFFGANLLKVLDGGWFTLMVALVVMIAMVTWRDGRSELARIMLNSRLPLDLFLADLAEHEPYRVPGTAVFMSVSPVGTPPALLHHLKHNQVLHQKVVLLSMRAVDVPVVPVPERLNIESYEHGFYRVVAMYGFMERPNVPEIMQLACEAGLQTEMADTSFFLGRESLLTTGHSKMMRWRKALFAIMSRNAGTAPSFFGIPPHRVVELGIQVEL